MNNKVKDPLTGEEFFKQRDNQKFATRKNQIRYNNLKARKKRSAKSPYDRVLDQNRTILERILNGKDEIIVSKDYLLGSGFHFRYFQYHWSIENVDFSGIYEYGIAKTTDGSYKIIRFKNG